MLNDDLGIPAMDEALSRVLLSSQRVTTIRVDTSIAPNVLTHLGTLPSLTGLTFALNDVDYRAALLSTPELKFAFLLSLDITTSSQNLEPLLGLLDVMPIERLRTLRIVLKLFHREDTHTIGNAQLLYRPPTTQSLQRLIATVSKFKRLQTLSILPWIFGSHLPEHTVSGDALRPLLELRELSELDMSRTPFVLAPNDAERMARAWPQLTSLHLGDHGRHNVPEVRPADLLHFVKHCPRLVELGLQLLCDDNPIPTDGRPAGSYMESPL